METIYPQAGIELANTISKSNANEYINPVLNSTKSLEASAKEEEEEEDLSQLRSNRSQNNIINNSNDNDDEDNNNNIDKSLYLNPKNNEERELLEWDLAVAASEISLNKATSSMKDDDDDDDSNNTTLSSFNHLHKIRKEMSESYHAAYDDTSNAVHINHAKDENINKNDDFSRNNSSLKSHQNIHSVTDQNSINNNHNNNVSIRRSSSSSSSRMHKTKINDITNEFNKSLNISINNLVDQKTIEISKIDMNDNDNNNNDKMISPVAKEVYVIGLIEKSIDSINSTEIEKKYVYTVRIISSTSLEFVKDITYDDFLELKKLMEDKYPFIELLASLPPCIINLSHLDKESVTLYRKNRTFYFMN